LTRSQSGRGCAVGGGGANGGALFEMILKGEAIASSPNHLFYALCPIAQNPEPVLNHTLGKNPGVY
jgi:hypothetical protein